MSLLLAFLLFANKVDDPALPKPAPRPMEFERDIEPILKEHCFACHGPQKQKNGFRLDQREAAISRR